jgi:hypothetical protein
MDIYIQVHTRTQEPYIYPYINIYVPVIVGLKSTVSQAALENFQHLTCSATWASALFESSTSSESPKI